MDDDPIQVDINDVIAELDPLGRALFDGAQARAAHKKLQGQNAALREEIAQLRAPDA